MKAKEVWPVFAATLFALLVHLGLWAGFWSTSTPIVMGDEFRFARDIFSASSNGGSFSNFVFSAFFQAMPLDSASWYSQVKLLNSILWAMSVLPLFVIFRAVSTPIVAASGALLASFLPIAIFSATVLPEVMFYLLAYTSLALFVWVKDRNWVALLVGVALGVGMLVKPHASFLIIALLLALAVLWRLSAVSLRSAIIQSTAILGAALLVRFGVGAILFGTESLDFFGDYASGGLQLPEVPVQLVALGSLEVFSAAQGAISSAPVIGDVVGSHLLHYLLAFAAVYLIPLVGVIVSLPSRERRPEAANLPRLSFLVATGSMVIVLALVALAFGVYVSLSGDDHTSRILFRYVDYLYGPLIVAAVFSSFFGPALTSKTKVAVAVSTLASGFALLVTSYLPLDISPADSAVLTLFVENPLAWLLAAAAVFLAGLLKETKISKLSLTAVLAGLAVASSAFIVNTGNFFNQELDYLVSEKELGLTEVDESKVLFVSTSNFFMTSTMMLSSSFDSNYKLVAPFSQVDVQALADGYEAIVLIGADQTVFTNGTPLTEKAVTRSYRTVPEDQRLVPDIFVVPDQVGVSTHWGFWVDGDRLEIGLEENLSQGSIIKISLRKHPLWQDNRIKLSIGGEVLELSLEDSFADQTLELEMQSDVDGEITIEAVLPQDLRSEFFVGDQYLFSIGLAFIEVDGVRYFPGD